MGSIPDGTKVIKGDGTIAYYEDLERHEVPDYVIAEKWYAGWNCIRGTSIVETKDGIICDVGSLRIGTKVTCIIRPDIPGRSCAIC